MKKQNYFTAFAVCLVVSIVCAILHFGLLMFDIDNRHIVFDIGLALLAAAGFFRVESLKEENDELREELKKYK